MKHKIEIEQEIFQNIGCKENSLYENIIARN